MKDNSANYNILLIDDELDFHAKMRHTMTRHFVFDGAYDMKQAHEKLKNPNNRYDLIWLDLKLAGYANFREGLPNIEELSPYNLPIVVVSNDGCTSTAVGAIKLGAVDYLCKGDFEPAYWSQCLRKNIEEFKRKAKEASLKELVRHPTTHQASTDGETFIGNTPEMQTIKKELQKLSEFPNTSVLLLGETGVGKEVAAQYLHRHSTRKNKPFVAVNLSNTSREIMESVLFGHKKGTFTGADKDHIGIFEEANGGILFLDEIGDIDPHIQVRLLRFLQDKVIRPIGGKEIKLDVQIVSATNANLRTAIEQKTFREDLYQRLSGYCVTLPPLRNRKEDIEALCGFFTQKKLDQIATPELIERFYTYHWPGNVRELSRTLESMNIKAKILDKERADLECVAEELRKIAKKMPEIAQESHARTMAAQELNGIECALINSKNKEEAAKKLGKTADQLLYLVKKKYYPSYPDLFSDYLNICKAYQINVP